MLDVEGLPGGETTECAQRLRWGGWEDEDEAADDPIMMDEDYAAEHNYRIY